MIRQRGRSVKRWDAKIARSGMMRRRGRNRRGKLDIWKKLAGLVASNQVALGSSGRVLSEDLRCEMQGRFIAPFGMIRRRGRGVKHWDAPLLALE